jgi:gliding motility-associated-like protein
LKAVWSNPDSFLTLSWLIMKRILPSLILLFMASLAQAQLGLCSGSKGDPIFQENFGTGLTHGPALPSGVTTFTFVTAMPHDGEYAIYHNTNLSTSWHTSEDHTPADVDGKALIVNAGLTAGEFYKRRVPGLCVNTRFEFSAWLMNIYNPASGACVSPTGKPVDVTFEIWDSTESILFSSASTGPIDGTAAPIWSQYAITFTMPAGQTEIVLKMRNNGTGGCGNDLAIDDIMFRACGDVVNITSPGITGNVYTSVCQNNNPVSLVLNANATNTVPHTFQWQQSTDNATWTDIPGALGTSYTTPNLISTHYYRTRLAQDAANLGNPFCSTLSDVFSIIFVPKPLPPTSNGDVSVCSDQPVPPLTVTAGAGESVNWYSSATGGTLLASNTLSYTPSGPGTYYAQTHTATNCTSDTMTAVTLTIKAGVTLGPDEVYHLCPGETQDLDAGVNNVTYLWQPGGETVRIITVSGTGIYSVTATSPDGCSDTRTFSVFTHDPPVISAVNIDDTTVTVITQGDPFYQYSLDGVDFQSSNIFYNVSGGMHTVYVQDINNCGQDQADFLLIVIPKYFTPNGDFFHDTFEIEGLQFIPEAKVAIFDRYGKLITMLSAAYPAWDGTLNGEPLPSTDYWYSAVLQQGKEYKGHFSLKR